MAQLATRPHAPTISRGLAAGAGALLVVVACARAEAKAAHLVSLGGHGTTDGAVIRGRAFKGKPSSDASGGGRLRKAASTARAFLRNDLENVEIVATDAATGAAHAARTDGDGFYELRVPGPLPAGQRRFVVTIGKSRYRAPPVEVTVVVADAQGAGLVVVTDIDDTIAFTGVTDGHGTVVARVATSNADDMKAIPGASATLEAFVDAGIPVVYLSAGPVELAHRTGRFLATRGFPAGPLFMRDYEHDGVGKPLDYKRRRIERVLADFPRARVVLMGDNGESDPEIYAGVARDTGRVAAIYVRAQVPGAAADPRYAGMTLFSDWTAVRTHAMRAKLLSGVASSRAAGAGAATAPPMEPPSP